VQAADGQQTFRGPQLLITQVDDIAPVGTEFAGNVQVGLAVDASAVGQTRHAGIQLHTQGADQRHHAERQDGQQHRHRMIDPKPQQAAQQAKRLVGRLGRHG